MKKVIRTLLMLAVCMIMLLTACSSGGSDDAEPVGYPTNGADVPPVYLPPSAQGDSETLEINSRTYSGVITVAEPTIWFDEIRFIQFGGRTQEENANNGFTVVNDGRFGFMDIDGNLILPTDFDAVGGFFSDGLM